MGKAPKIILSVLVIPVVFLIYFAVDAGFEDKPDPEWFRLDTIFVANGLPYPGLNSAKLSNKGLNKYRFRSVSESMPLVDSIYNSIQANSTETVPLSKFFGKPFMPSWEYDKLLSFLNPLLKNRTIVISGVTGSGKTTLIDRLAMMIAGNQGRINRLQCVENMDVEYHKYWVGYREGKQYVEGKILRLFQTCQQNPNNNFILILDDFDKIYPSTFFGSEIWAEMDNPADSNYIEGWGEVVIPKNFFMICVTHIGVGNVIEFNDEHFRRLGEEHHISPDPNEMIIFYREQNAKGKLKIPPQHLKKAIYFFIHANEFISAKYGDSYALGQWSTIRKNMTPERWNDFIECFVTHVNAFKPKDQLKPEDFRPILYTIQTNGKTLNSNFFYSIYNELVETGIFSELTVGIGFAILSAIFGWIVIFRKRNFLKDLHFHIIGIVENFKTGVISYDQALESVIIEKQKIEDLILKRKIKYEEVTYLLMFLTDQIKSIEDANKTRMVSGDFFKIFDEYAKDGVIDDDEYKKLTRFLDNIRNALNPEVYYSIKTKIESLRNN